ncbi:GM25209 [Drosophila sechellia]|uniref:GM25209 n=1 Tax=Drosophila sechellia TaxID=7238 RepID=B4HLU7_DROSE|nr:GM25209 [Drosophila sechellia]
MVIKYGFNAFPIRKAQFFAPRFDQSIPRTLALAANMKYHSQTLFFPSPKTFRLGVGIRYRFGFGFWFRFRFQFQLQFFLGWISCSRRREPRKLVSMKYVCFNDFQLNQYSSFWLRQPLRAKWQWGDQGIDFKLRSLIRRDNNNSNNMARQQQATSANNNNNSKRQQQHGKMCNFGQK